MTDEPFYSPTATPPRLARPNEPLWEIRSNGSTWEAELCYRGEWGVEAQIFERGDFVYGRRFDTRGLAMQWAEEERKAIESEGGN